MPIVHVIHPLSLHLLISGYYMLSLTASSSHLKVKSYTEIYRGKQRRVLLILIFQNQYYLLQTQFPLNTRLDCMLQYHHNYTMEHQTDCS